MRTSDGLTRAQRRWKCSKGHVHTGQVFWPYNRKPVPPLTQRPKRAKA